MLEVLIQITIIGRLLAGYFFNFLMPNAANYGLIMVLYVFCGLFFTEMLPLIVILIGINS
jgi:hypothetical protein